MFIYTINDLIGITIIGLLVLAALVAFVYGVFQECCRSIRRRFGKKS